MRETQLAAAAANLLTALWRAAWQGALAVGVLYALCRLLEARYPPSANLRCWLWRLGYLKMLLGLTSVALFTLAALPSTAPQIPVLIRLPTSEAIHAPSAEPTLATASAVYPISTVSKNGQATATVALHSAPVWIVALYLLGVGICLGRVAEAGLRTRRVLREATVCEDDALNAEKERLARLLGLRRTPTLALSPHVAGPCCVADTILLPVSAAGASSLTDYASEERRLILAHELAHIRRGDLLWEWLGTLTQVVFFFHPLVYVARREERLSRESAADTDALRVTQSLVSSYAELLVGISRIADSKKSLAGVVGVLERGVLLRRRLLYLKENNMISAPNRRHLMLGTLPILLVSAAVLLPWRITAPAAAKTLWQGQEGSVVTETIRLNHIDAKSVPAIMKDTSGIEQLTCDLRSNGITVRGSQKAVDAFKTLIKQTDVETPVYIVHLRFVRYHVDARGKYTEKTLQTPIITETELYPSVISVQGSQGGYALQVTIGHGVDAGQVEASVEVRELGEQGEVVISGKNERSLVLGQTTRITGMTNATDKALRRAVQQGEIVTDKGEYTGYYVEVKPALQARYSGSAP